MAVDGLTDQRIGTPSFISLVPCLIVGKYTGNVENIKTPLIYFIYAIQSAWKKWRKEQKL